MQSPSQLSLQDFPTFDDDDDVFSNGSLPPRHGGDDEYYALLGDRPDYGDEQGSMLGGGSELGGGNPMQTPGDTPHISRADLMDIIQGVYTNRNQAGERDATSVAAAAGPQGSSSFVPPTALSADPQGAAGGMEVDGDSGAPAAAVSGVRVLHAQREAAATAAARALDGVSDGVFVTALTKDVAMAEAAGEEGPGSNLDMASLQGILDAQEQR